MHHEPLDKCAMTPGDLVCLKKCPSVIAFSMPHGVNKNENNLYILVCKGYVRDYLVKVFRDDLLQKTRSGNRK